MELLKISNRINTILKSNKVFSFGSVVILQGQVYFLAVFVSRIFGNKELGKYSYIYSVSVFFATLLILGLNITLQNIISAECERKSDNLQRKIRSMLYVIFALIPIFFILFHIYYTKYELHYNSSDNYFFIVKFGVLTMVYSIVSSVVLGMGRFKLNFFMLAGSLLATFVFSVVMYNLDKLNFIYDILLFFNLYYILIFILVFRKYIISFLLSFRNTDFLAEFREGFLIFWNLALPTYFSSLILVFALFYTNRFLLHLPENESKLALYNIGNTTRNLVLFIPMSSMPVVMNNMARNLQSDIYFHSILKKSMRQVFVLSFFLWICLALIAPLYFTIYGYDFTKPQLSFLLSMGFVAVLQSSNSILGLWFIVSGKIWIGLALNILWLCFFAGLLELFGYLSFDLNSVSAAYSLSYIIYSYITYYYYKQKRIYK